MKTAKEYGIEIEGEMKVNFPALMERMKRIRAEISKNDSAKRFTDHYGLDIYMGQAKFLSPETVEVNGKVLKFKKACIASGGRPRIPDYAGLYQIKYYTSDNIFNLVVQPKKMLIVGTGPIGCELGQSFARLGTKVTMFERGKHFLPRDDPEAVDFLKRQMEHDGVRLVFEASVKEFQSVEGFP